MSDQVEAAAAPAAPQAISMSEGLARYTASKAAAKAEVNPVSEAASVLGKQGAAARAQARQAQATQAQEPPEEEQQQTNAEDDPEVEGTLDETATDEQPAETEAVAEDEPAPQTIDLGDGLKVTLDEVRDGFMMKADHTRKTQALASERNQFESDRTQRLQLLDTALAAMREKIGQPKSLSQWLSEDPVNGLARFAEQSDELERLALINRTRAQEQQHHDRQNRANVISALKETHGDKAEAHFNAAVDYAAANTGMDKSYLGAMLANKDAVAILHKAIAFDAIQAGKGKITKLIAEKPKVTKPGSKVSAQASQQTNVQAAHAKLKSSGKLADAVALLRTIRGGRRS